MTSINKVILIGNLGRVARDALDADGRQAFDCYAQALYGLGAAFRGDAASPISVAARRLAEALRQLLKVVGPCLEPVMSGGAYVAPMPRTSAFFHPGKVDARNLP